MVGRKGSKIRAGTGSKAFDIANYVFMIFLTICFFYPFWYVLVISFSTPAYATSLDIKFWPTELTLDSYREVFSSDMIVIGFKNSLFRTIVGTALMILFTYAGAYVLSKKNLPMRGTFTAIIMFTMFFSGGLIPSFILIRNLGLMENLWALILPGLTSAWFILIARNFIMTIPDSMEESATIDGANPLQIMFKIMMPLSAPIIAVIALWSAVGHWNAWFDALLYARSRENMVLQLVLRRILIDQVDDLMRGNVMTMTSSFTTPETIKMAMIVVTCFPIVVLYPFLQKYFVKGIMMGALKG